MLASPMSHQTKGERMLQLALLLAAGLVMCVYVAYGIHRSLWLDEANTVHIADGSPRQIMGALSRDVSPPLYYFLLSGWMRLFGDSEIAVRLPSVLFYLAGICVMWFLGQMLFGRRGAALTAFIYAVDPIIGRQAQNARMYSLIALLAALSMMVFVVLIRDKQRRTSGCFALFGAIAFLGLNTHYWFCFVLLAYGSWILFTCRSWRVRDLALLGAFVIVPFLIVNLRMVLQQRQLPATLWTPHTTLGMLLWSIWGNFGLVPPRSTRAIVGVLVLVSPIAWSILARRCKWQSADLRRVLFLGCIYAATVGFPFLISVIARPIFWPGRYDSIAVPFFALFAASLLLCLPRKPQILFQFFLAGLCGAYFVQAVRASETTNWLLTLDPVPLGDRDAGRAICMQSAPGDFVIYTGLSRAAISYYLQRFNCGDKLKQISYPAELDQHLGWQDERRDYSQEPAARREAESVVDSAYTSRSRIFLLFDPNPRLSAGIVASIERHFRMASSERFVSCGTCFSEVRVYVRNPAPLQGQANFYHSPVGQPWYRDH